MGVPLALFLLALGLRLAYIQQTQDDPSFRTFQPGLDLDLHWQAAQELRAGPGAGPRFALMMPSAPLFPAWLALSQGALGDGAHTPHRVPLAVMGALTVLLVYFIVLGLCGRLAPAVLAGLLAAGHAATVYFDTRLIKVAPELLLLAALLALLLRFGRLGVAASGRRVAGLALAVGGVLSLLLASQIATVLFVGVSLWAVGTSGALTWRWRAAASGMVLALVMVTAALLGRLRWMTGADHPVFVPQAGVHLRVGFHEGASGTYHRLPGIPGYPFGHTFIARLVAEGEAQRPLSFAQADRHHRNAALAFVWERPGPTLGVLGRKLRLFFNAHEPKGNEYLPALERQTPLLAWLPGRFGLLWVFATWGGIALWAAGRRRELWLLLLLLGAVLATNLAAFVTWRYRIHAVVPLFVLAGIGLAGFGERCWRWWGDRAPGTLGPLLLRWVLPAAAVALLVHLPLPAAVRARMASTAAGNREIVARAAGWAQTLRQLPDGAPGEDHALLQRAVLLRQLERHTEAFRLLRRVVARSGRFATANAMYLEYLAWLGDVSGARRVLGRLGGRRAAEAEALVHAPVRAWLRRLPGGPPPGKATLR